MTAGRPGRPTNRRQALLMRGLGVAGTTAGGAGMIWTLTFECMGLNRQFVVCGAHPDGDEDS